MGDKKARGRKLSTINSQPRDETYQAAVGASAFQASTQAQAHHSPTYALGSQRLLTQGSERSPCLPMDSPRHERVEAWHHLPPHVPRPHEARVDLRVLHPLLRPTQHPCLPPFADVPGDAREDTGHSSPRRPRQVQTPACSSLVSARLAMRKVRHAHAHSKARLHRTVREARTCV